MFANEPALIVGVVEAGIVLAVAFGAPISPDQKAAIIAATSTALALAGALLVRANVSPVAAVKRRR